jgi:plastocyanin
MKSLTLASLGVFAALASANAVPDYMQTVVCTDKTVTQTVTVTAGSGPQPTAVQQGYSASNNYGQGMSTSVVYSAQTTSTMCPSAGTYPHPQMKGSSIQCGMPGWTTYTVPYTTVSVYPSPTGSGMKDCTVAVYQDITVISIVVIDINVTIVGGQTTTVTVTKSGEPSVTPPPPTASTTSDAPYAKKTHTVNVGGDSLIFSPNSVDAKRGDVVLFNFLKKNHTLTQSEFNTPCTPDGKFDTGFTNFNNGTIVPAGPVRFEVETESPQWFFCKQPVGNHCGSGMVFGLNPAGKMDQFIKNAIAQNGNPSATPTYGGTPSMSTGLAMSYNVTVGLNGGKDLVFSPPYLQNVKRGERIYFDFRKANHTLTESSFDKPCTKLSGTTVDTDFMNFNPNDIPGFKPFTLTVDSDGERFFYCRQGNGTPNGHCSKGMVFAINVDQDRFGKFLNAAKATLPKIKGRTPSQ